jgi:RES domain-containing protein
MFGWDRCGEAGLGRDCKSRATEASVRTGRAIPDLAHCRGMDLAQLVEPARRMTWVCRPQGVPSASALDLRSDRSNRWNAEAEPTVYLSGDPGLALIESGRHPEDLQPTSHLLRVELRLMRALDLRRQAVRAELRLPTDDDWILDRDRTRAIAGQVRRTGACDGLLVPSAGALDQEQRWNAVVFADDPATIAELVGDPQRCGTVCLDASSTPSPRRVG